MGPYFSARLCMLRFVPLHILLTQLVQLANTRQILERNIGKQCSRFFRYLRGSTSACLHFRSDSRRVIEYVVSVFVEDLDKRRSQGTCSLLEDVLPFGKLHYIIQ